MGGTPRSSDGSTGRMFVQLSGVHGFAVVDFKSRKIIHEIAKESGGEVFSISSAAKIGEVTHRIEEELRSQYILAFRTDSQKPPGEYRAVTVAVTKPGITARTIRGYIP